MEKGNVLDKLETCLMAFVERAAKENATAEEIEALPAVAAILVNIELYPS